MSSPLRMAGPPRRIFMLDSLEGSIDDAMLVSKDNVSVFCENQVLPCRYKRPKGEGPIAVKLRLPADTEPGTYPAALTIEQQQYEVEIEVQPNPKIKITPSNVMFTGKSGAAIETTLALENKGNVPIDIPNSAIANLYRLQEVPSAFASTMQLASEEPSELVNHLLVQLKQGYGGVMKCHLEAESHRLLVNQKKLFHLKARIPKLAKVGNRYTGIMHIGQFHVMFEITVT